jgi:hypothetical protein
MIEHLSCMVQKKRQSVLVLKKHKFILREDDCVDESCIYK